MQPASINLPTIPARASRAEGFLVWSIGNGEDRGLAGVADDCEAIRKHLAAALREMPEGRLEGYVRYVRLDRNARHPSYIYDGCLATISRDDAGALTIRPAGGSVSPAAGRDPLA